MIKNKIRYLNGKRGWIRIVEAFIAILLVAGILLLFINKGYIGKKNDLSEKVYQAQLAVLREIELDETMRGEILTAGDNNIPSEDPPYFSGDDGNIFPPDILDKINERVPDYLECSATICNMETVCPSSKDNTPMDKDIYAQAVSISTTSDKIGMRQLKIFCWTV